MLCKHFLMRYAGHRTLSHPIGLAAWLVLLLGVLSGPSALAGPLGDRIDRVVQGRLAEGPEGTTLTVWAGFADGRELYARDADRPMPVASAIKAAILLELYAKYEGEIDQRPAAASRLLDDENHPAFAHYRKSSRAKVREALGDSTVDEIGRVMIGKTKAPNLVYNGAANVAIGLLGGPQEANRSIRKRDPAFGGLTLNRYMLANRTERGDNTATASALAAVHRRLATRNLPGLREETIDRVRAVLAAGDGGSRLFSKGGSLTSDPLTRVRAGWREGDRRSLVWVVMGSAPKEGLPDTEADHAYGQLRASVSKVWEVIDAAYRSAL